MVPLWNDSERLRRRAEETRAQAAKVQDPEARRVLLEVAECYAQMARKAEAWRSGPGPSE